MKEITFLLTYKYKLYKMAKMANLRKKMTKYIN